LQKSDFYLYALYNKNKPKSDELMNDCGSEYFRVSTTCNLINLSIVICPENTKKHNSTITYSRQNSETTIIQNTALYNISFYFLICFVEQLYLVS